MFCITTSFGLLVMISLTRIMNHLSWSETSEFFFPCFLLTSQFVKVLYTGQLYLRVPHTESNHQEITLHYSTIYSIIHLEKLAELPETFVGFIPIFVFFRPAFRFDEHTHFMQWLIVQVCEVSCQLYLDAVWFECITWRIMSLYSFTPLNATPWLPLRAVW